MPFVRGDLYRLRAPKDVRGHEQAGTRFAVVVQSDDLPLSTWVVAPTSTGRREATFRPEIEIGGVRTRVMSSSSPSSIQRPGWGSSLGGSAPQSCEPST